MSYQLTITPRRTYLYAIVTGTNSKQNVENYLEDIRRECAARGCFRVLIEERLDGPRLGTAEVFEIASTGSHRALGTFEAIAYVDSNAEGDLMAFAETVAVNRSLPVKVFSSVQEAETWIQRNDA